MRIIKKLKFYKRHIAMCFTALLFMAIYIPSLPAAKAIYALDSVQRQDAVVYMYGQTAAEGTVFTGSYYRMQLNVKDIKSTKETLNPYFITVKYKGDAEMLLGELNLSALTVVNISGGTLYTGYSANVYGRDITMGTRRVNVQVYVSGDSVTLGWPVIYGSY